MNAPAFGDCAGATVRNTATSSGVNTSEMPTPVTRSHGTIVPKSVPLVVAKPRPMTPLPEATRPIAMRMRGSTFPLLTIKPTGIVSSMTGIARNASNTPSWVAVKPRPTSGIAA